MMSILTTITILGASAAGAPLQPPFSWDLSAPLVAPAVRPEDPCVSVKDPSVVQVNGRWHVFCSIRSQVRTHQIEYLAFDDWSRANSAPRHILHCRPGYFCAPQVFFFRPQGKWYLVYQVAEPTRRLQLHPAFSTTDNLADPDAWSPATLFFGDRETRRDKSGIDFWVICDTERAYLFYTTLDGHLWRMWTRLEDFPRGFDHCELALQADIFEAAHIYRLLGEERYLAVIEAQGGGGRRYYKAYLADRLDGAWQPLADREQQPFAGAANVRQPDPAWADNISHGELIRTGCDETLTVDPVHLQFLIQGVLESEKGNKPYGAIPWRLGLLTLRHG